MVRAAPWHAVRAAGGAGHLRGLGPHRYSLGMSCAAYGSSCLPASFAMDANLRAMLHPVKPLTCAAPS